VTAVAPVFKAAGNQPGNELDNTIKAPAADSNRSIARRLPTYEKPAGDFVW